MDLGTLKIGIQADLSQLDRAMASVTQQTRALAASVSPVGKALKESFGHATEGASETSDALRALQKTADDTMSGARSSVDKVRDALGRFATQTTVTGQAAQNAGRQIGEGFARGGSEAEKAIEKSTGKIQEMINKDLGVRAITSSLNRIASSFEQLSELSRQTGDKVAADFQHMAAKATDWTSQLVEGLERGGVAGLALAGLSVTIEAITDHFVAEKKEAAEAADAVKAQADHWKEIVAQVKQATDALGDYHAAQEWGGSEGLHAAHRQTADVDEQIAKATRKLEAARNERDVTIPSMMARRPGESISDLSERQEKWGAKTEGLTKSIEEYEQQIRELSKVREGKQATEELEKARSDSADAMAQASREMTRALEQLQRSATIGQAAGAQEHVQRAMALASGAGLNPEAMEAFKETMHHTMQAITDQVASIRSHDFQRRAATAVQRADVQGGEQDYRQVLAKLQKEGEAYKTAGLSPAAKKALDQWFSDEVEQIRGKLRGVEGAGVSKTFAQLGEQASQGDFYAQMNALRTTRRTKAGLLEGDIAPDIGESQRSELMKQADDVSRSIASETLAGLQKTAGDLRTMLGGLKLGGEGDPKQIEASLATGMTALGELSNQFGQLGKLAGGIDQVPGGREYQLQLQQLQKEIRLDSAYEAAHKFGDGVTGALLRMGHVFDDLRPSGFLDSMKEGLGSFFGGLGDVSKSLLGASGGIGSAFANLLNGGQQGGATSDPHIVEMAGGVQGTIRAMSSGVQSEVSKMTGAVTGAISALTEGLMAGTTETNDAVEDVAAKSNAAVDAAMASSAESTAAASQAAGASSTAASAANTAASAASSSASASSGSDSGSSSGSSSGSGKGGKGGPDLSALAGSAKGAAAGALGQAGGLGQIATGAATGGGMGAFFGLMEQSSEFKFIMAEINNALGPLLSQLMKFLAFLAPTIAAIMELAKVFGTLAGVFEQVLKPGLNLLFTVIKGVAEGLIYVVSGIQYAWENAVNGVLDVLQGLLGWIPGVASELESWKYQNTSWSEILNKNMAGINQLNFDQLNNDATNFGQSLNNASGALNAFAGYKVEADYASNMTTYGGGHGPGYQGDPNQGQQLPAHAAGGTVTGVAGGLAVVAAPGEGLASVGPGETIQPAGAGGQTSVHIESITIHSPVDGRDLWKQLKSAMSGENVGMSGSTEPSAPRYTGALAH